MDEVSARAKLATAEPGLTVSVPRSEVEAALEEEGADLVLDVVRSNGDREERRVVLALDEEMLRRLVEQDGEQIMIAIDPESLAVSFDAVEAHGMREVGATLAIIVGTVGAGAGTAAAEGLQPALSSDHAVQATVVEAGMPRAMPADYAAAEQQMPRAMPSDYAAADDSSVTLRRDPGAMPTGPAVSQAEPRGIENIRASQPPPAETPDPMAGIEAVRVGGPAVPDPSTGIENVRAQRGPAEVEGGGATISAPSTGAAVAIAGGAMLTIAAAAFALRRRREPGLA
jgi:hypothetical protein